MPGAILEEGRETLTYRELEMGKSSRDWFINTPRVISNINFMPIAKDPSTAMVDESSKRTHLEP